MKSSFVLTTLKSRKMKLIGAIASFSTLLVQVQAVQLSNDPPSYFGGPDYENQEYLDWVKTISSKYNSSSYLPSIDPSKGAAVHWRIVDDEWLEVAVAVRSSGWVGFGISEAGGMLGSDMALFVANRPSEIVDAHVVDSLRPEPDDCQQDWILVEKSSTTTSARQGDVAAGQFLMFEARRKLDTGDPQDKRIYNDSNPSFPAHRIIAAWGDSEEVGYHGTSVARGAIRFFDNSDPFDSFRDEMDKSAEGSFSLLASQAGSKYRVPASATTYVNFCLSRADIISQGTPDSSEEALNIIGFRPIVDPGSAAYVHHFIVSASTNGRSDICSLSDDDDEAGFDQLVYVWAPGEGPFALPDFLGATFLGSEGYQSFLLEVHYNNPGLHENITDSSGVEFYYTSQPREMEIGVLQTGDPLVELENVPVGKDISRHDFECPGSCSSLALSNGEPVTVIREYLHMHNDGIRMTNSQIRDGEVVRQANVEVWDFDQNGNAAVQQEPFQILPGDSFRTTCYYKSDGNTVFGLASQEEMCIAFLYYYPRKIIKGDGFETPWFCAYGAQDFFPPCAAEHEAITIPSKDGIQRLFGESMCMKGDSPAMTEVPQKDGMDGSPQTTGSPVGSETDEPSDISAASISVMKLAGVIARGLLSVLL